MPAKQLQPRTEDRTIHVHKIVHKIQFKKRAPRAISKIKEMATKCMGTKDVRIDQKLNKFIWSCGIRNLPRRVRVRFQRKRNEDENAAEKMYTVVAHIPCERDAFKNMQTEVVTDDA